MRIFRHKTLILISLAFCLLSYLLLKGADWAPTYAQESSKATPAEPFRNEIPTDSQSVREFTNRYSFDNPDFRREKALEGRVELDNTADATQAPKQVRMIYLIPSDKVVREDYRDAIANAIISLQRFYQSQVGSGKAFSLHTPIVESYVTSHPTSFYSTGANAYPGGFFESVLKDGFALTGGGFNDPDNRWIFYMDAASACGQYMGGTSGVALLAANDLRGLTGQSNIPACSNESPDNGPKNRWIGGLGHELGHAFNLPHPPGCDQGNCSSALAYSSLMWVGYASYPQTYLLEENKTQLLSSGFFSVLDTSARVISGRVTDPAGNGLSGVTVVASGTSTRSAVTDSGGNYALNGLTVGGSYTITPSMVGYSFSPLSQNINHIGTDETANFAGTPTGIGLSSSTYSVAENDSSGAATITVNRTGDISASAAIDYLTSDSSGSTPCQTNGSGIASDRCDYATAVGTLRFAAGETSKTILIPIINDAYLETDETFTITLRNPQGASLGTSSATVTIRSDDTQTATTSPIEDQAFFIKQQYIDFLGRVAEPAGFNFWMNRMTNCPAGDICDRIDTSKRFFESDEFKERGFYVYRLYDVVLGRLPKYAEFIPDVARLNGPQTVQEQRLGKDAYLLDFMNKAEFRNLYDQYLTADHLHAKDSASATSFVNALCTTAGITPASKQTLITNLQNGTRDPAHTLEDFILTPEMSNTGTKYYDRAIITMQYFGYLRRDPERGTNPLAGFDFWWDQLTNPANGHVHDYRFMVGGFLQSDEYGFRFALISTTP